MSESCGGRLTESQRDNVYSMQPVPMYSVVWATRTREEVVRDSNGMSSDVVPSTLLQKKPPEGSKAMEYGFASSWRRQGDQTRRPLVSAHIVLPYQISSIRATRGGSLLARALFSGRGGTDSAGNASCSEAPSCRIVKDLASISSAKARRTSDGVDKICAA